MNADGETGRLEANEPPERFESKGRMIVDRGLDDRFLTIDGNMIAEGAADSEEGDLRRLAACWNACEGLPTEVLEQAEGGIKPLAVSSPGWLTFLARNREELTSAQEALRVTRSALEAVAAAYHAPHAGGTSGSAGNIVIDGFCPIVLCQLAQSILKDASALDQQE